MWRTNLRPSAKPIPAPPYLVGLASLSSWKMSKSVSTGRRSAAPDGSVIRIVQKSGSAPDTESSKTPPADALAAPSRMRSEEHTSELQSLMRNSYAVFCLKKKKHKQKTPQ